MTAETRTRRLAARVERRAALLRRLAAFEPGHYARPRDARRVKTRLEQLTRRLDTEIVNLLAGRAPGWRRPLAAADPAGTCADAGLTPENPPRGGPPRRGVTVR